MSSLQSNAYGKTVTWTNTNYIGLTQRWVDELMAKGYKFIDRRPKETPEPEPEG